MKKQHLNISRAVNKKGGEVMNIRKQSADEHTVIGYADFCACAAPRAMCGCSIQTCSECGCDSVGTLDTRASVMQFGYDSLNSGLRDQASYSAQAKMIH